MADNVYYVTGAYAVMWIVLVAYVLRLRSLLAKSRAALAHARAQAGRAGGAA